jgi:formate dehydrogenase subunit gamma
MLPTMKDIRDVVKDIRFSFGLEKREPQFGRFDYRQKFEYWGILFGGFIIIISGLFLWFPTVATAILPGQVIPAAKEFHGNEATLAAIVIVIWHLYDVMLRPGIFPADTTIFTGKISKHRIVEEHPLEYAEITGKSPSDIETHEVK